MYLSRMSLVAAMRMMQPLTVILYYEEQVSDVPEQDELGGRYEDDSTPHHYAVFRGTCY